MRQQTLERVARVGVMVFVMGVGAGAGHLRAAPGPADAPAPAAEAEAPPAPPAVLTEKDVDAFWCEPGDAKKPVVYGDRPALEALAERVDRVQEKHRKDAPDPALVALQAELRPVVAGEPKTVEAANAARLLAELCDLAGQPEQAAAYDALFVKTALAVEGKKVGLHRCMTEGMRRIYYGRYNFGRLPPLMHAAAEMDDLGPYGLWWMAYYYSASMPREKRDSPEGRERRSVAEKYCRRFIERYPDHRKRPFVEAELAKCLMVPERRAEAMDIFLTLVRADDARRETQHLFLVCCTKMAANKEFKRKEQVEAALGCVKAIMEKHPEDELLARICPPILAALNTQLEDL